MDKFRTLFHIKKYLVKYNINNNVGFSNSFIELIQKDPIKTADFWIKTIPLISEVQETIKGELDTLKLQRKNLQQSFDGIYSNYKSLVSKKKEIDADLKDLLNKKQGLTSVGANLQNNITSLESDLNKVELNLLTSVQLEKNKKLEQATFIQIEKTKNLITLSPDSIELSTIRAKLNDLNIKLKETRDIIDNHIKNVQLKESYTLSLERSKKKLETNKQNITNYNFEIDKQIKLVNEHNEKLKVLRESYESKDKEIVQLADKIKEVKKTKIYFNLQSINENIKVEWQPAIIGRPDNDPTHNKLLAINLQAVANGMSVSRKHAQILEEEHRYFIEPLSTYNPTYLNDETTPIEGKRELVNNDCLYISKARIKLIFTICPE